MSILVVSENSNKDLKSTTLNCITAARKISDEIHLIVIGNQCEEVVKQAALVENVKKVLHLDDPKYALAWEKERKENESTCRAGREESVYDEKLMGALQETYEEFRKIWIDDSIPLVENMRRSEMELVIVKLKKIMPIHGYITYQKPNDLLNIYLLYYNIYI